MRNQNSSTRSQTFCDIHTQSHLELIMTNYDVTIMQLRTAEFKYLFHMVQNQIEMTDKLPKETTFLTSGIVTVMSQNWAGAPTRYPN